MNEQETRTLLTAKLLLEQSGARLDALATSLKTSIENARKNFNTCKLRGGDVDMENVETCLSMIQGKADALCLRKDQFIASHENLIAVALNGEERYWTWPPETKLPPEVKVRRWQIKSEECLPESRNVQLQMAELEQTYIAVIADSAQKLQLISNDLTRELLEEAGKNRVVTIKGIVTRLLIEILKNISELPLDFLNFKGRLPEDLLNQHPPPLSASS